VALSRRAKILLATSPLQIVALVVIAWFVFTAHRSWKIPDDHKPPKTWLLKSENGGLSVRSLGVSGFEISDGTTVVLLDPTPTRPDPLKLITGPIEADLALEEKWCPKANLILVNHSHFDHALDVGEIARRTGAVVVGSQNAVNLALSRGVSPEKTKVVHDGDHFVFGTFTIDVKKTRHTDILVAQPMSGVIPTERKPLWFWQYALDDTFAYRLEANHTTLWFHPTSTFVAGELGGLTAKNLIVGVTGEKQTREKVEQLMSEAHAVRVMPTHLDNFFQPVTKGLALMPGLDLDSARDLFKAQNPSLEWGVLDLNETVFLPPDEK